MNSRKLFESNHDQQPRSPVFNSSARLLPLMAPVFVIGAIVAASPGRAQGNNQALFIDTKGNVGIGTDRPEQKLHVVGTLKASGFEGDGTVPKGAILMWSGQVEQIPKGWALCDGTNGTPDLRSRFIVGAGKNAASGPSYKPNDKGDPDKLPSLSVTTNPAGDHDHKFPQKYYARQFVCGVHGPTSEDWCTGIDTRGDYQQEQRTQGIASHSHTANVGFDKANSGENRPRWWALCFIIKI